MNTIGLIIKGTEEGSIARKLNFEAGDKLISINNVFIGDIIDYLYSCAGDVINVMIKKGNGKIHRYKIHKRYDKTLGILFEDTITNSPKRCGNHCIFCFVDQMPKGMRKSLYIKDDDYRLSFLDGNFVTLTNLNQDDLNRIVKLHLSPLYISVHATDTDLRNHLIGRKKTDHDIMKEIGYLVDNNIKVYCQIVMCPDINDGQVLEKTIFDLSKFYPGVVSCAAVPVGLTKFRDKLTDIGFYNKDLANEVLDLIFKWNRKLKFDLGTNFIYPSDEFFSLADNDIPDATYYEGYPLIENGVGMLRKLIDESDRSCLINSTKVTLRKKVCILTSKSAYKTLNTIINKYFVDNGNLILKVIKNEFWGGNVDVAGLITAHDIIDQLDFTENDEDCNHIIIPANMLKEDEDLFLDEITLTHLQGIIGKEIIKCKVDGVELINTIMEVGMGSYE